MIKKWKNLSNSILRCSDLADELCVEIGFGPQHNPLFSYICRDQVRHHDRLLQPEDAILKLFGLWEKTSKGKLSALIGPQLVACKVGLDREGALYTYSCGIFEWTTREFYTPDVALDKMILYYGEKWGVEPALPQNFRSRFEVSAIQENEMPGLIIDDSAEVCTFA